MYVSYIIHINWFRNTLNISFDIHQMEIVYEPIQWVFYMRFPREIGVHSIDLMIPVLLVQLIFRCLLFLLFISIPAWATPLGVVG